MAFEYKKKHWVNYPHTSTPIMADDLNRIETAIQQIAHTYATTGNVQDAIASVAGMVTTVVGATGNDLNNFTQTGFYYFGGSYRATANYPGNGSGTGWLLVIDGGANSNRKLQIWVGEENLSEVYYRHTDTPGSGWVTPGWTMLFNAHSCVPIDCGGTGASNARQALQNLAVVEVTEALDLNNVTDTGIYSLQNLSAITNAPDGVSLGCVYVTKLPLDGTSGARYEQILIGGTNNVSKHKVYIRHGIGDDTGINWSSWVEILDTTDLSDYVKNTDFATTSSPGIMTAADKTKLNGIATGANKTTVDTALSSTSTNPVQNKVVNTALNGKANTNHIHSQYYSSDDNTSGTLTLSLAIGASGDYCTMADKAVEVGIVGTFAPTATGSATVTTIPFSFSKSKSFICHDMTHNTPLNATLSKTGELKINFKQTGQQSIVLHETFICK